QREGSPQGSSESVNGSSQVSTSNDWQHWVTMHGNANTLADDVRGIGDNIGVRVSGDNVNMFSVLMHPGNSKHLGPTGAQGGLGGK
ncbi:endonuclease/exonuclease/phosphatase family protein, partial [Trifolium medium]|nr:endonuclease/exonuclease/phosphatase family protein [Trifolium medium]